MSTNSGGLEGGGGSNQTTSQNLQSPGQVSTSSVWTGHGAPGGNKPTTLRTFAQIVEQKKLTGTYLKFILRKLLVKTMESPSSPNL